MKNIYKFKFNFLNKKFLKIKNKINLFNIINIIIIFKSYYFFHLKIIIYCFPSILFSTSLFSI